MRADARRNQQRLLDAAIELVLEIGGEPSRDAVAQRAGVGIGTLYRHFPDQQALLRAVVLDVLDRTIRLGETTLAEAADGREALRRYLHGAIDSGLGVVNVIYPMLDDTDWPEHRAAAAEVIERLTEAARRDGAVGRGVTPSDIAIASIRFCRPLAIGLAPAAEREIAHAQLDHFLDGLAATASRGPEEQSTPPGVATSASPGQSRQGRQRCS
jgi:AcrR family transcriptional regulator